MTRSNPLGINLSFCVKRWVTPQLWAGIVRDQLDLDLVQFSFDLVDPMWPNAILSRHACDIAKVTQDHGITIHSAFIGLAHYTFNQLLHPDEAVRDYAEFWLERAYGFAAEAGIQGVGGPLGAIASRLDGTEAEALDQRDYEGLIERMLRLGRKARAAGLRELYVEPTPMRREWPWTIQQSRQMMDDLQASDTPWRLCVDWGHGTVLPLYGMPEGPLSGPGADPMEPWFAQLHDVIAAVHIQQTDFQSDCHWDFTVPGRVDPGQARSLLARTGLAQSPVLLEVFYPFERDSRSILDALKASALSLKQAFA
ncbi:TIM barrel protein [Rhizobium sp. SSA_523]|uniref:sugar phosphate isomerase/epimerase family protein n=1 Tax=Rhizobium sp. SSA_523 TaxID=2952477 RepID=UPI002090055D|nr:TIM barrel protein [Rhizobium sp. SSA_523]MCO5734249.1 sugar phosphate isomerase/epimerase [Rhizobium sp. SSA_523]WKC21478.1 TIM barrel protein [Rhizobium sp. SSA_523]